MKFNWRSIMESASAMLLAGVIVMLYRYFTYPGNIQVEAEYSWVNSFIELYPVQAAEYGLTNGELKRLTMEPGDILQFYALTHPIHLHVDIAECEYDIADRILWLIPRIRAINHDGALGKVVTSSWVYQGCTDENETGYEPEAAHWVKCCFVGS